MSYSFYMGRSYWISHTLEENSKPVTRDFAYYRDLFAITTLIQGSGACYVEGNRYQLKVGEPILLRPDELRCYRYDHNAVHERMTVYLQPAFLSDFLEQNYDVSLKQLFIDHLPGEENVIPLNEEQRAFVLSIFREIRDKLPPKGGTMEPACAAEVHLQILRLLMMLYRLNDKTAGSWNNDPVIQKICRYIHNNLNQPLSHEHIRKNCHVSRYQLGELFPRNTGMTLIEYINRKRIIKVIELVRNGIGIEQAADMAGFGNYSYFYKVFKREKGVSPRKYFEE